MTNTNTAPAARYARSFPALTGEGVTEGHARYCRDNGHAVHTVDGIEQPHCPRCGADRDAEIVAATEITEADRVEAAGYALPRATRFDRGTGRYGVTLGGYGIGAVRRTETGWTARTDDARPLFGADGLRLRFRTRGEAVEALGRTDGAVKAYREAAREGAFGTAAERVEARRHAIVMAAAAIEGEHVEQVQPEAAPAAAPTTCSAGYRVFDAEDYAAHGCARCAGY